MIVKLNNMAASFRQLGRNIKRLRLSRGITQDDLARRAGLKLSNYAKLEGGFSGNPTLLTLTSIAKILTGGSVDKLLR